MESFDAIVIGCGPGGSTTASYLAKSGKRVLVLEKEFFPRFHIGESLLPYNTGIFKELGLEAALKAGGFPRKVGAQFILGNGSRAIRFIFRQGRFNRFPEAIQVERSIFDHILMKHSRSLGADVREGWTVKKSSANGEKVTVEATDPDGKLHTLSASFLIDASGRGNLTGNQEGIRVDHPDLKKLAIFGHFTGVKLDECDAGGDTVIFRLENKWFWVIPLNAQKTSVGVVMDKDEFTASKKSPGEVFDQWVESSLPLRERMAAAQRVGDVHVITDYSYSNRSFFSQRLLRVGDAAGFIDPIFSSGVLLAMYSGKLAAGSVLESLNANDDGSSRFPAYERAVRRAMKFYLRVVEGFYTTPFMELLIQPQNRLQLTAAVNAVLAGELEGKLAMRIRLELFFLLVRLQRRWTVVPKISFAQIASRRKTVQKVVGAG